MSFANDVAKLHIGNAEPIEGGDVNLSADYNPKELQVDKTMPWSKHSYSNKNGDTAKNDRGNLHLEFTGAEGRSMTIELMFDGYETGKTPDGRTVKEKVKDLERLTNVINPKANDEQKRRPPMCVVAWGNAGLPSFRCVIESLSTKYTMFGRDGAPLRATCTVKLKEADTLSTKDAEDGAAAGGGAAAPAGGKK
jgi:contractile injection system tube protein